MPYLPHVQKIVDHLWPDNSKQDAKIYAILDTARDDDIYGKILACELEGGCLYQGQQAVELAHVAPYLIWLHKDDDFTEWVLNNGWGDSWGIFVESSVTIEELMQHFRKFLKVSDEEGNLLMFRYYDPRVLRVYLPTCNEAELEYVFGPVERYYAEAEKKNDIIQYSFDNRLLAKNIF